MALVFKIMPMTLWRTVERDGIFHGAPADHSDGYIHLSTAAQVRETAVRHFSGQVDLLLVAYDGASLGPALKWEPSRGGALFPHLYTALDPRAARWVKALPVGRDGKHVFPALE